MIKRLKIQLKKVQNYGFTPPTPKNVNVYPNSSYSNLLNRISPMVCLITVNNFTIALEAGIPRNSHNFNGMGQILPDIGMTPLKFNGYRNIPPFFTGYRNGEGGCNPLLWDIRNVILKYVSKF